MTATPSMEFWIAVLFIINLLVVVFLFFMVKKLNRLRLEMSKSHTGKEEHDSQPIDYADKNARKITDLLEPLVEESRQTAIRFESQIKEKKRLIKELNEALDSRIISINLLLSRADAQQRKLQDHQDRLRNRPPVSDGYPPKNASGPVQADDQQHQILSLYYQNNNIDSIARKLSIPKGEVQLVIDLKEKFLAMEKNSL